MPWKDTTIMEQKIEFICEWRTGKYTITELCKSFEISRPTAYKIIARFEKEGYEGLRELSRKPRGLHPNATNEKVVNSILQYKENLISAKAEFTRVFRKYGIPRQMHTDNGSPFGSVAAIQRFTRLSYWFIELGIQPVFSDPAHPEQNGRHERMHRDLKASCAKPSACDLRAQQRRLNHFVKEYNHIRPHEALGMETPASAHSFSARPFPEKITNFDYDSEMKVLKVTQNGSMRWGAYNWVYLSASLTGKYVGALEMGNGIWRVFYRNVFLGYFDENELRIKQKSVRLETNLV